MCGLCLQLCAPEVAETNLAAGAATPALAQQAAAPQAQTPPEGMQVDTT